MARIQPAFHAARLVGGASDKEGCAPAWQRRRMKIRLAILMRINRDRGTAGKFGEIGFGHW
jgi:hypothetical protein